MFCRKCGRELDEGWKICPGCGQSVDEDGGNNMYKTIVKPEASQEQSTVKRSANGTFCDWIPMAVCFAIGIIVIAADFASAGVFLFLAGILMCPKLLHRVSKKIRMFMIAAAAVLAIIACVDTIHWFTMDRGEGVIDYVKQYQVADGLSIGEMLEMDAENGTKWTYYEDGDTEYVAVNYNLVVSGEAMEIIFSVKAYPALYGLRVDGEPDAEMFDRFDSILSGGTPAY